MHDRSNGGERVSALPRITVRPAEAAEMLGISRDHFDAKILPELAGVYRSAEGRRGGTVLIPVRSLEEWVAEKGRRQSVEV